jgi:drug/metabolite transporter (DMT)-like permease
MSTGKRLQSETILLLTALIWGLAFVAQRVGMEYMGPFTFNGLRFALGSLSLLPVLWWRNKKDRQSKPSIARKSIIGGGLAGLVLFLGASTQQIGLMTTTAGKAGFITGLYVILVPLLGLLWGQRTGRSTWLGVVVAVVGLYYLSVRGGFYIAPGDKYVLLSAFCWAGHVQIIDHFSARVGALRIAFMQFLVTSLLSFFVAWLIEDWNPIVWGEAWAAVLYAGLLSVGIGYTLQVIGQKDARPPVPQELRCFLAWSRYLLY